MWTIFHVAFVNLHSEMRVNDHIFIERLNFVNTWKLIKSFRSFSGWIP